MQFIIGRKSKRSLTVVFMPKQTKEINKLSLLCFHDRKTLNEQTDLKELHSFKMFYFVYMWRTLPPF